MATLNIKIFTDIEALEEYHRLLIEDREKYVVVSSHTPLLSNLNIIENIALIEEVHQRYDRVSAHNNALKKLSLLNMESLATKRPSQCNTLELFSLMLIRASMMQYVTIVIITPLVQYQSSNPVDHLINTLQILEIENRTLILDLALYKNDYKEKGLTCHTIA